jgi:hypothetical protein
MNDEPDYEGERLVAEAQEILERWQKAGRRLDACHAEQDLILKQDQQVSKRIAAIKDRISQGVPPEEVDSCLAELDAAYRAAEKLAAYTQSSLGDLEEIKEEIRRARADRQALEAEGNRYFELEAEEGQE